MHASTQAIFDGSDQPVVVPVPTAAERLSSWFAERLDRADTRLRLYSLSILLQQRYFYERRRSGPQVHEDLHHAYEACFDRLEERIYDTEPPLPDLSVPVTPVPEPTDEEVEATYTELFWRDD